MYLTTAFYFYKHMKRESSPSCSPMISASGKNYIKVEACGSVTGNDVQFWDDGVHSAISQICVYSSANAVNCIQVAYLDPRMGVDRTVFSAKHGDAPSSDFAEMIISPRDRIVLVSGYTYMESYPRSKQLLLSLEFATASGITYGPYGFGAPDRPKIFRLGSYHGKESFCFKTASGVRGFHGSTSGSNLSSIGIYVESQASSSVR